MARWYQLPLVIDRESGGGQARGQLVAREESHQREPANHPADRQHRTNINLRPGKGVPPIRPGFMPARGPLGWLRDAVMTAMGNRLWRRGLLPINQARAEVGRVFILTSPSFDFGPTQLESSVVKKV